MLGHGLSGFRMRFALLMAGFIAVLGVLEQSNDVWFPQEIGQLVVHLTIFALGIAAVAAVYVMAGRLTRPIEILRKAADAVGRGRSIPALPTHVPVELRQLGQSLRDMVEELHANTARMSAMAFVDDVTGLANRAALSHVMGNMGARPGAVLYLNLDKFKPVNDIFGHELGDALLASVGGRIRAALPDARFVDVSAHVTLAGTAQPLPASSVALFRFSGDEFVLLVLDETDPARLAEIGHRLVAAIGETFDVESYQIHVGVSIGICRFPDQADDIAEALSYADLALDVAKAEGGGRAVPFIAAMQQRANDQAELEADLMLAFKRDELVVHYQPKVSMRDRKMMAVEALVRWQHPARGLLFPDRFLPIVDKTGMIHELGKEVCRKALKDAKAWRAAGLEVPVAVNVIPNQFLRADFTDEILAIVDEVGIEARFLELELTETVALEDPVLVSRQLDRLRAAGIAISIDDFGTGYSNIAQLCKLSFDTLKLDKSLIDGIGRESKADAIVNSLVVMAHAMGLKVVAEGVETEMQWTYLRQCGCEEVQGYLVARPMPADRIVPWCLQSVAASGQAVA